MKNIKIIAEIGINHNGNLDIAKELILSAKNAGADLIKFQKRTIDLVYTSDYLASKRESPFGSTQRDQKEGLEFGEQEYISIDQFCKKIDIQWFASAWDLESQKFLSKFNLNYNKVASAMLSHENLVKKIASEKKHTFISTGMHTIDQINQVVEIFKSFDCPFELMHTCSEYPMSPEKANLLFIPQLKKIFGTNVGYSGHETGIIISVAAAALGASSIERHITLDRSMYGSDQSASIEIVGFEKMCKYIRVVEESLGVSKKIITDQEKEIFEKLKPINS
jgi:N-acetylneuraminate synthase